MSKPYLSIQQQINHLINNKRLIVNDTQFAEEMLTDIGYFSLIGGYKQSFVNQTTNKYDIPTSFEDILALYRFDESLRELTFAYLTKIEQKVQQLISDSFCSSYGQMQSSYLDPNSYSPSNKHKQQIAGLVRILGNIANSNNDHEYLIYHRKAYGNVPLWVTTHAMTFGQISNMYAVLNSREQSKISKIYPHVSEKELEQYLSALTLFRNTCAHEERLFSYRLKKRSFPNTVLHQKMNLPQKGSQYTMGKTDYFGLIISFRYLLRKKEFQTYKRLLKKLIDSYCKNNNRITKSALLNQMGMPANWESITRFRL